MKITPDEALESLEIVRKHAVYGQAMERQYNSSFIQNANKVERFIEQYIPQPQWEFTEDEKIILRNLPNEYRWIARDDVCDGLFAYTLKPTKFEHNWVCVGNLINLTGFRHLFQSIKWTDDEPFEFRRCLYE